MKKLVALGLLMTTVAFAATVSADGGGGGSLQDREVQRLFEWSARAADAAKAANQGTQTAGPGARPTKPIPPVLEYRGSEIR